MTMIGFSAPTRPAGFVVVPGMRGRAIGSGMRYRRPGGELMIAYGSPGPVRLQDEMNLAKLEISEAS